MKKNKLLYSLSLAASLNLLNPSIALAEEKIYFGYSEDELKEKAVGLGKKLTDTMLEVEKIIEEKAVEPVAEELSEIELYKPDSLWLIIEKTDEEYKTFFVNKNIPIWSERKYFSKTKEVTKHDRNIRYIKEKTMYPSLTNPEDVFIAESMINFKSRTLQNNYQESENIDLPNEKKYLRISNCDMLLKDTFPKEKYSTKDLQMVIEEISKVLEEQNNYKLERKH